MTNEERDRGIGQDEVSLAFAAVEEQSRAGEWFRMFDLAAAAAKRFPSDWRFAHRAVLALARAGALAQAREQFAALGLGDLDADDAAEHSEVRALKARIKKDAAISLAPGPKRSAALLEAGLAYERIMHDMESSGDGDPSYSGINAATLFALARRPDQSRTLATRVLQSLEPGISDESKRESADLWTLATALEAAILLGNRRLTEQLVPALRLKAMTNWGAISSTLRQLSLIVAERPEEQPWIDGLRPPPVIHYTGHIISKDGTGRFAPNREKAVATRIAEVMDSLRPGHSYGSLAAGADILFAEATLTREGKLSVVLPCELDEFLEFSVAPAGSHWVRRFQDVLQHSEVELRFANDESLMDDESLFAYGSRLAMGLAALRARHLGAASHQVAVWDSGPARGFAGTTVDVTKWKQSGRAQTIIPIVDQPRSRVSASSNRSRKPPSSPRHVRAMLFGDFKGFSKLRDRQLVTFVDEVLGRVSKVVETHKDVLISTNTWGDGIFLVTRDANEAAEVAFSLQSAISSIDHNKLSLPQEFALRIGGHLGPVFDVYDPVLRRLNVFGAHVSRAARVEPVTPPGCIYVTESFAAALELEHASQYACDFVGTTESAKGYGQMRMFLLRRC